MAQKYIKKTSLKILPKQKEGKYNVDKDVKRQRKKFPRNHLVD